MEEFIVYGDTLPEAYHAALCALQMRGTIEDCADWNTRQKECSITMCVKHPLQEPMISPCMIGGPKELEQYRQEMLDGILDFEVQKGNWAYTYHDRMVRFPTTHGVVDQVQYVIDELRRSPSSRRAVIVIRDVGVDTKNSEPACLQTIQYFIRDNALHCKVLFRSNDACKATGMNAFALIMLQSRIADELGIPVGTYTHRANSFHAYERDWEMLNRYVDRIMKDGCAAYSYTGEWKEYMDNCDAEIKTMVAELKKHYGGPEVEPYEL